MEALFVSDNAIFYGAILAVLFIGAIEAVALLCIGAGFSDALHTFVHADIAESGDWLLVKDLPLMAALVLFLTGFGLSGLGIRYGAQALGYAAPLTYALVPAIFIGYLTLRVLGKAIAPVFAIKTDAVELEALAGSTAMVIGAAATSERAGEARLKDKFGNTHYLQVIPQNEGEVFRDGEEVVLTQLAGHRYKVIAKK